LQKRKFKKFKLIESDIEYSYKYADRTKLNALKDERFDEIIIVKNGLITDTTISNLAFFDGEKWLTPKTPLLKGTKREELLKKGSLIIKDITPQDIKIFSKIAMINAVLGFFVIDDFDIIV
jgi:4-amino-4-deoxychorismate lyase